jgi:hypothetical protein
LDHQYKTGGEPTSAEKLKKGEKMTPEATYEGVARGSNVWLLVP